MNGIKITKTAIVNTDQSFAIIASKGKTIDLSLFSETEVNYINGKIATESFFIINQYNRVGIVAVIDQSKPIPQQLEEARKIGTRVQNIVSDQKIETIQIVPQELDSETIIAVIEGLTLSAYRFVKHFSKADDKKPALKQISIVSETIENERIAHIANICKALYWVRDLVNEPVNYLNAEVLSEEFLEMSAEVGLEVEVFDKIKIEALKMGGLLAVNKGSVDPPTFTTMEWKPANAINAQPYVLVGKGVVYDTGGLSLKPTGDSMDYMKSDMSGAAIVAGVMYAIAANKLPLHVVALVPATDNRPSGNAYAPGDVITISDGTTVEMLNADAEGRMILSDALVYAKKYNPQLVIDVATLTGAASVAIGPYAIVAMGTASNEVKAKITESGNRVYERIVEFPLWDEYAELIKSDIADIKNVGGKNAGAITAGKFLEHFTSYPWIHFDIAGVAFSKKNDSYRGKGGTGYGMRLLCDFLYNCTK